MSIFSTSDCYLFIFFSSGMTTINNILKSRDVTLPTKIHIVKSDGFSSSQEQMLELDHKESWALKDWCFWKSNLGRTDAEAHVLWPTDVKNQLIWKDPDTGKEWGQGEKGVTEDEMVREYHWLKDMSLSKLWEIVKDREVWHAEVHGVTKIQTQLSN